jgi:hypothetical protein
MNCLLLAKTKRTRPVENRERCQTDQKHFHDFFYVAAMGYHRLGFGLGLIQKDVLLDLG